MGRNRTEVVVNFAWFAKCNLSLQYETVCTVSVNRVDEIKVWDFILCKSIYHFSQVIFGENLVIDLKNVQYVIGSAYF